MHLGRLPDPVGQQEVQLDVVADRVFMPDPPLCVDQPGCQVELPPIGREGQDIQGYLEGFLKKKSLEPMDFQRAEVARYTEWIHNHRRIGNSDVYLVGDAAGHVKVTTVGGIVTGFHGALGVAEAICNGGSSRKFYRLRQELERHNWIRSVLHQFRQKDYVRLLNLLTPSVRHSLSRFTRDETMRLLLSVVAKQPRLLLLGLRSLLIR